MGLSCLLGQASHYGIANRRSSGHEEPIHGEMAIMCRASAHGACAGYQPNNFHMVFRRSSHTIFPRSGCLPGAVAMPVSHMPDTVPLHSRYASATFPMPASCVFVFARMPVHSSGLVSESHQPTYMAQPKSQGKPEKTVQMQTYI